jgi:cyclopropane fatty-acyl-phospholipid synthase-like methyltransferase
MAKKVFFSLTYWFGTPPWDTGTTPPEVYQFLEKNPPGRALDLGCGTGTNVITIAEHGWTTEGVDFIARAVRIARRKVSKSGLADRIKFRVGDILAPSVFEGEYDLILDIGCFHNLAASNIDRYIQNISSHLSLGGSLLLYVHLDNQKGANQGSIEDSLATLGERIKLVWRADGAESSRPSAWLEFRKE